MRFLSFKEKIGDQLVFTFDDAKKIESNFEYRRLTEWQKKGYIRKIIKGYYTFSDIDLTEERLFAIANRIYFPSYISLESALRYYNFIPEGVFKIISISTKKTSTFETKIGIFSYKKIKPSSFFDYQVIGKGAWKFKIATPEKAIIDYFYFNSHLNSKTDIESLRINKDIFLEKIDINRIEENLKKINNKNLDKRIDNLLTALKNA